MGFGSSPAETSEIPGKRQCPTGWSLFPSSRDRSRLSVHRRPRGVTNALWIPAEAHQIAIAWRALYLARFGESELHVYWRGMAKVDSSFSSTVMPRPVSLTSKFQRQDLSASPTQCLPLTTGLLYQSATYMSMRKVK